MTKEQAIQAPEERERLRKLWRAYWSAVESEQGGPFPQELLGLT